MPPVFGIIKPDLQIPEHELILRMTGAAIYAVPRKMSSLELPGISVTTALPATGDNNRESKVIFRKGGRVIAADANLYNKNEIQSRLGDKMPDNPSGEAELILRAYEKWGESCMNYLYGDFAFVILDLESGDFFCGRDPLGVRPFFYGYRRGNFLFSSELRMVLAGMMPKPALRTDYLLDSLVTVKSQKAIAPFEDIFRLPPAHTLACKKGELKITPYWKPDLHEAIRLDKEEDYTAMFRELLVNAVHMRCNGVSSLGSELSGGLDSSAVTGLAAEAAASDKIPFTAYSNVFPTGTGVACEDEQEFIREMLAYKSLSGTNIDGIDIPVTEQLRSAIDLHGTFIQQNYSIFNQGLFRAAAQRGTTVLLSGFGGDELVSSRVSVPWNELIRDRQWKILKDEIFYPGISMKSLLKPGLIAARYVYSLIRKPAYRTGVFTPELLSKRLGNLPLNPGFVNRNQLGARIRGKYKFPYLETLNSRQLHRLSMDHVPQRMEYCYAAAAQYGIEYRYPLLDVNLVLACLAFPPWIKQHHGINRYIFRQAIAGFVPEMIRFRDDKSGSTIPHTYYSLIRDRELILELIRSCEDSASLKEIFDLSRFPSWYEKLVNRDPGEINYLMRGAFYDYLMILLYYKNNG